MMLITVFILYCVPAVHLLKAIMCCDWCLIQSILYSVWGKKELLLFFFPTLLSSSIFLSWGRRSRRKSQFVEKRQCFQCYVSAVTSINCHFLGWHFRQKWDEFDKTYLKKNKDGQAFPISCWKTKRCWLNTKQPLIFRKQHSTDTERIASALTLNWLILIIIMSVAEADGNAIGFEERLQCTDWFAAFNSANRPTFNTVSSLGSNEDKSITQTQT